MPGLAFFYAAFRNTDRMLISLVAAASCIALAAADIYYYFAGVIRWVYLVDAGIEFLLAVYWIAAIIHSCDENRRS